MNRCWVPGLLISLVGGMLVVEVFLRCLRARVAKSRPQETFGWEGVKIAPAWLTGVVERTFFTLVVTFDVSGAATAMMGWLTVKMVSHWNRDENRPFSAAAFTALLAGLLSMLFALVGGLICKGRIL